MDCEDLAADYRFVIYNGNERYPLRKGAEAIGLLEMLRIFSAEWAGEP